MLSGCPEHPEFFTDQHKISESLVNRTMFCMGLTFKTWFRSIMATPVISIYPHR